jgi:3-dehydroquinate dehydratase-1
MRPCIKTPLSIRGSEFGGSRALFCIPLVASSLDELLGQSRAAHSLTADVVEWRADFFEGGTEETLIEAARQLRSSLDREPILFTLRSPAEGGKGNFPPARRAASINAVVRSGLVDLVDVELSNGESFVKAVIDTAHEHGTRVILSFHDFGGTPENDVLLGTISEMVKQGADIAKLACMPQRPMDALRMLQVTLTARERFPTIPLCTMSMGAMGSLTRTAGFLFGSDMAFAVGKIASAPGQIPIAEARDVSERLLRFAE